MKRHDQYFNMGAEWRAKGNPIGSCPFLWNGWPAECWHLGWNYANCIINSGKGGDMPELLKRIDKRPFDQGAYAFYAGIASDDCPFEPLSKDGIQWEAGWIAANDEQPEPEAEPRYNTFWRDLGGALLVTAILGCLVWAFNI